MQAKSTSKFPGFWEPFEKAANAAGVSVTEYDVLLKALETGSVAAVFRGQRRNHRSLRRHGSG